MDGVRNTKFEQLAIFGLLAVFVFMLQSMLRRGRPDSQAPLAPTAQPITQTVPAKNPQGGPNAQQPAQPVAQEAQPSSPGPVFSNNARDPMMRLLPGQPASMPGAAGGQTGVADPRSVAANDRTAAPPAAAQRPAVEVRGLILGGAFPQAIIDGGIYRVGETVNGATIIRITKEGVTFEADGAVFVVSPAAKGLSAGGTQRR